MSDNSYPWSIDKIPSQQGKTILITGANAGLGLASAQVLAEKGAHIILACRYLPKAEEARDSILAEFPEASLDILQLDLADLESVKTFAEQVKAKYGQLHVLMNNAGLNSFRRWETPQGYEQTFAINHLGHFALTAHLFGLLKDTPNSRVVTVSSSAHRSAHIDFDDLMSTDSYRMMEAYGQSKLANLLFAKQLHRIIERDKLDMLSLAIHPGLVGTNMVNRYTKRSLLLQAITRFVSLFLLSPRDGARPQLFAATAEGVEGGKYYVQGPEDQPIQETPTRDARNQNIAERLWKMSEELTGTTFPTETKS